MISQKALQQYLTQEDKLGELIPKTAFLEVVKTAISLYESTKPSAIRNPKLYENEFVYKENPFSIRLVENDIPLLTCSCGHSYA